LKDRLGLRKIPQRIEAFDISNLQGGDAVGSLVRFEDGEPVRDRYRHFKIKTITGADDPGMMGEVLFRHYQKALASGKWPDLVLLDGGRGQLGAALKVFQELGVQGVDLIGLAKGRKGEKPSGEDREMTGEKFFHPAKKEPIFLESHSPGLNLLDRIRDEAHRFAIAFHRKVRNKGGLQSVLLKIPGVGPERQKELLRFFGGPAKISEATVDELGQVPGLSRKTAQAIHNFFRRERRGEK
jgi:excinuclease ABC subunit C